MSGSGLIYSDREGLAKLMELLNVSIVLILLVVYIIML